MKTFTALRFASPLLALPFLASCAGTFQQQKMQSDIDGMQREIAELRAQQKTGSADQQLRQRLADLGTQIDQLRTDLSLVQGRLETLNNDLSKRSDETLKVRQDLEIRIAQLDDEMRQLQAKLGTLPPGTTGNATGTATPTSTAMAIATPTTGPDGKIVPPPDQPAPTPHPTTPGLILRTGEPAVNPAKETDQSLYQKGVESFDGKHFEEARRIFAQVITRYPKSEFADNARYWIGESYYAEKDYASAALEFEKVVKDYPAGDKVPAAMLKEGYAFLELGEKDGGAQTLKMLIKKYPKSEEAKKAKQKLAKLK